MRALLELFHPRRRERGLSHPMRTLRCRAARDRTRWRPRRREFAVLMSTASSFRGPALGIISLGALAADQLSKHAVEKYTSVGSLRVVIPGLLNLVHTTNPGVA